MKRVKTIPVLISFLVCILVTGLKGQNVRIGNGISEVDSSAILEIDAPFKGFLIPRMTAAERLAIPTPAKGLLVFQNNGLEAFYYFNGGNWDTLNFVKRQSATTAISNTNIAIVSDIKMSGQNGGTFASGTWIPRDLNHLKGDSSFIAIDNINTFTLDSGIYQVNANSPARSVSGHQVRLFDITNNQVIDLGTVVRSSGAGPNSILNTIFKINSSTTFQIQHRCESTEPLDSGMGEGGNWGDNIYTQIRIRKM